MFLINYPLANLKLIKCEQIHFINEPASQRAPMEIWERIASHIPRYHLRTWLFISSFHRDIAVRHIFHTVDIYFGEDQDNLNRGLDIFDRAKSDPVFACRVKSLRLHWAYEEGDMLDLMARKLHLLDGFFFMGFYKLKQAIRYIKEYLQTLFPNSRLYEILNGLVIQRCVWIWYKPSLQAINIFMDSDSCM